MPNLVSGFTLIELLVVLAIIIIITSVVFVSQSSFNKTLILANTAYDIALMLRSAQTYGLGSRAAGTVGNTGYGLHFDRSTPGSFTFFADTSPSPNANNCHGLPPGGRNAPDARPGDCVYRGSPPSLADQKVTDYTLGNGITIRNFCAYSGASGACKNAAGSYNGGLSSLDIVFVRPNPDAFIRAGRGSSYTSYSTACIAITSPQGGNKYISVAASGAITAHATSCP